MLRATSASRIANGSAIGFNTFHGSTVVFTNHLMPPPPSPPPAVLGLVPSAASFSSPTICVGRWECRFASSRRRRAAIPLHGSARSPKAEKHQARLVVADARGVSPRLSGPLSDSRKRSHGHDRRTDPTSRGACARHRYVGQSDEEADPKAAQGPRLAEME